MIDRTFGGTTPIAPIPALAELRDMVLARSKKRRPKWRFRLAPDLVLQLQPATTITGLACFAGEAVECCDADDAVRTENIGSPALQLRFPRCDLIGMNVELLRFDRP
jgi:hypothetical protein